jgi:hypothetical protein
MSDIATIFTFTVIVFIIILLIIIKVIPSKKKDKEIGLIVPFAIFLVSIIAISRITVSLSITKTIIIFMLMNIPTIITLVLIYFKKRS